MRIKSRNKSEFQFIDSIAPIEIEEKQNSEIKEVAKNTALKDEKFDIQAVFLPELTTEEYQATISNFKQNIENMGGNLIREPYQLTNGMVVAIVKMYNEVKALPQEFYEKFNPFVDILNH